MDNEFQTYEEFLKIFRERKNANYFKVTQINFSAMEDQWYFDGHMMSLKHSSDKFFKIEGIRVKTNWGDTKQWDQPIINQHEIGILGIITKVFNKKRYYLMQAKMEPGCINEVQLSPTVQATKSNFSQVHKGKLPTYLEYFLDRSRSKVLIDQLQSEQGGRFLRKRNRNMVVEVKEDIEVLPEFYWLTLEEIKRLMRINNFVNMDTRSIISLIPATILPNIEHPYATSGQVLTWYVDQKVDHELEIEKIPLNTMKGWHVDDNIIWPMGNFFSVIAVKVEANREVTSWTQPMIKDLNVGLMGFLVKEINGIKHFLVQTKVMPGNIDIIDLSPSVATSAYADRVYVGHGSHFIEYFLNAKANNYIVHLDVIQSEEGGRFFHFQNRNMIVEIPEDEKIELTNEYMWLTYDQIMEFMPRGMFNIESRSLIAAIDFI